MFRHFIIFYFMPYKIQIIDFLDKKSKRLIFTPRRIQKIKTLLFGLLQFITGNFFSNIYNNLLSVNYSVVLTPFNFSHDNNIAIIFITLTITLLIIILNSLKEPEGAKTLVLSDIYLIIQRHPAFPRLRF